MTFFFLAELWAAGSAAAEAHGAPVSQVIFPLINFLIFLYLIKRFVLPFAREHLRTRRAEIATTVQEAEQSKGQAEAMVQDYRGRLRGLEDEAKRIGGELVAEGERERARLLREAEETALRVTADADFLAAQEVKSARRQLRAEMARMAQASAQRLIQSHFTSTDQNRLVEEFLSGVGQNQ